MRLIQTFAAYRVQQSDLENFIAPPYDVITTSQARAFVQNKPKNILHITRPEVDCSPSIAETAAEVYECGQKNLQQLLGDNMLQQDNSPSYYILRMTIGGKQQTGLVCLLSSDAYQSNRLKKHETTRHKKQTDRMRHLQAHQGQVSPVLLSFEADKRIENKLKDWTIAHQPELSVTFNDVLHQLWRVDNAAWQEEITTAFEDIETLYIADGHHRCAAAAGVAADSPHQLSKQWILSAIFPSHELEILGYHRVVRDLNGLSAEAFLSTLADEFEISKGFSQPQSIVEFSIYSDKTWWSLRYKANVSSDPVVTLPADICTDKILKPLGISDLRSDERIDFVGGHDAVETIIQRVDSQEMAMGCLLYPTNMQQLMAIADRAEDVSPKSTWFEPKLLDGLAIYLY